MSRPETLQPIYNFSCTLESVVLLHGSAIAGFNNKIFSGEADLLLLFHGKPCLLFRATLQGVTGSTLAFCHNELVDPSFSFNGKNIEGFYGRPEAIPRTKIRKLDWYSKYEPIELDDMVIPPFLAAFKSRVG